MAHDLSDLSVTEFDAVAAVPRAHHEPDLLFRYAAVLERHPVRLLGSRHDIGSGRDQGPPDDAFLFVDDHRFRLGGPDVHPNRVCHGVSPAGVQEAVPGAAIRSFRDSSPSKKASIRFLS